MTINSVIERTIAVVTRDGHEIEWFQNEREASAYVQHVYGLSPYDLIGHPSVAIGGLREPRLGDLVKTAEGLAVLGSNGHVCLNARTFRAEDRVSCSGGPTVPVDVDRLRLVGLERVQVWRWADGYPAAHNDGYYGVTVPVWEEAKP
jgi:hypothetical protein